MNISFLPFNTHPLFGGTLFLMVGICSAAHATYIPTLIFAISALIAFVGDMYILQKKYMPYIMCFALFWLIGYAKYTYQLHAHTTFYVHYGNTPCVIQGTITDLKQTNHPCMNWCITISVDAIKKNDHDWTSCSHTMQIHTKPLTTIHVGDRVTVENLIFKTKNESDFAHYLIKEKIAATVFMPSLAITHTSRPTYSITRWIFNQRERVFTALQNKILDSPTFTLFSALFFGNRMVNKKEIDAITDQFKLWGCSHYLARSGLHMVIFIVIWQTLLRLAPVSFIFKQLILLCIGSLFFILSWPTISFIRAFSTFIYCNTCLFFNIRPHFLHTIVIVTLATLILNPMHLFFLDFQLSFSLTFGIAWLNYLTHASKHTKKIEY